MGFDFGVSKTVLQNALEILSHAVGLTDTQELENKTISTTTNKLTSSGIQTGDLFKGYANDHYGRLARGSQNQALISSSTDIFWGTVPVAGGGTGQTSLSSGAVLIGAGTSGITTKANPAGAFLGTSDVQNITGLKTFFNTTWGLRNPADTFTMTVRNPAITSAQDYRFNSPYAFSFFKDGSTYYAKSGVTKGIESSNSDASTVLQYIVTTLLASSRGGTVLVSGDNFTMQNVIDIPTSTSPKPISFLGTYSNNRNFGTQFEIGSSFPTNRFLFETSGATDTSLKHSRLSFRNIGIYNTNFATINAGGIKFETDYAPQRRQLIVDNFYGQYLYKGIAIEGPCWWSYLNNLNFEGFDGGLSGQYDIKLSQTGTNTHTDPSVNGWPKSNHFSNIIASRNPGTMVNSLRIDEGGYNTFTNYMVDGTSYSDAIFRFGTSSSAQVNDNTMYHPWSLDNTEIGGQVACLAIDGANTYDNRFYNSKLSRNQYMVAILNGAYRNYVELAGYWGAHAKINNSGCGNWNVIVMQHGSIAEASTENVPIFNGNSTDNGKCRFIDNRKGSRTAGTSVQSGNASTTAFNIAHGCYSTPTNWTVREASDDAIGPPKVTATSTNLVVTYPVAPASGTNNLTWVWSAEVSPI
jgi:hypothetical protein